MRDSPGRQPRAVWACFCAGRYDAPPRGFKITLCAPIVDEPEKDPELVRLVAYIFEDEDAALAQEAKRKRTSKSEIVRRALRRYLGIED